MSRTTLSSAAMSQAAPHPPDDAVCAGPLAESLLRIREPGRRLALWHRRLPAALPRWLSMHFRPPRGQCRFAIDADLVGNEALEALIADRTGLDDDDSTVRRIRRDLLDLVLLARRIAPQSPALRLRLERIEDAGCRLFHVDQIGLRLICTYLGPGTQWLPESAFDRQGLGCGCNDHVRDWDALREVPCGAVAVMKGERYPGNAGRGLAHRSPPASPQQPRVVLAIDAA